MTHTAELRIDDPAPSEMFDAQAMTGTVAGLVDPSDRGAIVGATDTGDGDEGVGLDEVAHLDRVLNERAATLSAEIVASHDEDFVYAVALVVVAGCKLGLPSVNLREIVPLPAVSTLPDLPDLLLGITQIRGDLMSVVDTSRLFGLEAAGPAKFLAVIEGPRGPVGLTADAVLGFKDVHQHELASGFVEDSRDRPVKAMTEELLTIVDIDRLLTDPRIVVS